MYEKIFQKADLTPNESILYELLLKNGEQSVSQLMKKSSIHRRNIYDILDRMAEKGYVYEIIEQKQNYYQAVDPQKFIDHLQEKVEVFQRVMPQLTELYQSTPDEQYVRVYRGPEGWKNYMRDMLRVGEPCYFFNTKGGWFDPRVSDYFPKFYRELERKGIASKCLFEPQCVATKPDIVDYVTEHKILPENMKAPTQVDVFGDHINITHHLGFGQLSDDMKVIVLVHKPMADTLRTWFDFIWDILPDPE